MTNSIHSTIISKMNETHDAEPVLCAMVNVRPGEKVAAMVDLLCRLSGMTPSALVSDEIPRRLAKEAIKNATNKSAINYAVNEIIGSTVPEVATDFPGYDFVYRFQEGSALYIIFNERKLCPIPFEIDFPDADEGPNGSKVPNPP